MKVYVHMKVSSLLWFSLKEGVSARDQHSKPYTLILTTQYNINYCSTLNNISSSRFLSVKDSARTHISLLSFHYLQSLQPIYHVLMCMQLGVVGNFNYILRTII